MDRGRREFPRLQNTGRARCPGQTHTAAVFYFYKGAIVIDLKELLGHQYCVWRESHTDCRTNSAEMFDKTAGSDPARMVIPAKFGHIYVHSHDLLGAATTKHGRTARRLANLECVRVTQDADDGINVVFDPDDFEAVAAILRPRRRRRLTPAQVAEAAERLRRYQFAPAAQCDCSDLGSVRAA